MTALSLCYSLPRGCNCVCVELLPQCEIEAVSNARLSRVVNKNLHQYQIVNNTNLQLDTNRTKSTSCSAQSRPHPSRCTLFYPFRGPNIGTHHSLTFGANHTLLVKVKSDFEIQIIFVEGHVL